MSSIVLFANLTRDLVQESSIQYLHIPTWPANLTEQNPVLGFFRVPNDLDFIAKDYASTFDEKHRKAASKGTKIVARMFQVLNGNSKLHRSKNENSHNTTSAFVYCGETAVVGGPPFEGRAREMEGISWYQEICFTYTNIGTNIVLQSFASQQMLHFSAPTLKLEKSLPGPDFDRVEIVSGMCLFNAKILEDALSTTTGVVNVQKLRKLKYLKPTLYEMEYIARASATIADLAATIILRAGCRDRSGERDATLVVNLDIPSFHYYNSIHEKLEQELCTFSDALEWLSTMEKRRDQLSKVLERSIVYELARRGVSTTRTFEIRPSPKSNVLSRIIRQSLKMEKLPVFDQIFQRLSSLNEAQWQVLMSLLTEKDLPQDFRSLGYLFYVFEAMRPTLSTVSCPEEPRSKLLMLSVDDSSERRIYSRSQKLLKRIRHSPNRSVDPTLVEIYMSRRIFIDRNIAGSNLYLDDPSPETLVHARPNAVEDGAEKRVSEPTDVISGLYGEECARNLQQWFSEACL